jgi:hypothetical protein
MRNREISTPRKLEGSGISASAGTVVGPVSLGAAWPTHRESDRLGVADWHGKTANSYSYVGGICLGGHWSGQRSNQNQTSRP